MTSLIAGTANIGRTAVGGLMGLALAVGLAAAPVRAFAQTGMAPLPPVTASPAPPQVVPAAGQGPALWVIRDADSTLYLFGTIHVLRPTTGWGSAKIDAAFDSASAVWFEIENPDDTAAIVPLMQQYGRGGEPLSHRITSGQLTMLDYAAREIGTNAVQMDPLRPWLVALTLSVAPLAKAGYDPKSGAELILKARAEAAGKPIHAFETLDQQVRVLATLPEEVQLQFLTSTLHEFENASVELDDMVAAWAAGDVDALADGVIDDMKAETPVVYEALLTRRNEDWAGQIQTLLAGSGTAFIAVGAAHLAGPDSVQAMLEARGVTVERQ